MSFRKGSSYEFNFVVLQNMKLGLINLPCLLCQVSGQLMEHLWLWFWFSASSFRRLCGAAKAHLCELTAAEWAPSGLGATIDYYCQAAVLFW